MTLNHSGGNLEKHAREKKAESVYTTSQTQSPGTIVLTRSRITIYHREVLKDYKNRFQNESAETSSDVRVHAYFLY